MKIVELLSPASIQICSGELSKKRVLDILSEKFAKASHLDAATIFQQLVARERLGSTALGNGVALPHIRMPGLEKPIGVFLLLQPAIDFDSPDDNPVDLVFGLMVPESATEEHLKILAELAEKFHDKTLCEKIRCCDNNEKIQTLLCSSNSMIQHDK